MEGLTHGWKKSVTDYHYFDNRSLTAICSPNVTYVNSVFKTNEFLTESELDIGMNVCNKCYSARQHQISGTIIQHHKESTGFWDNTHVCPECKTAVIFFNTSKSNEHLCTVCNEMVVLS